MFAPPDTVHFNVRNSSVIIGGAHERQGLKIADKLGTNIYPAMEAIGTFLDSLPADKYIYLVYFNDDEKLGDILLNKNFKFLRFIAYMMKNGLIRAGALEHMNSSFYYLPDLGGIYQDALFELMKDISAHEFLHIVTPLNLHSQHISDFDYSDPVMSKHLWLYEGVTEYFANLIQVRGGLITPKDYVIKTMRDKIRRGERFPYEKMSFTEMSTNVLQKKYKKHYNQVYQRGSAQAMLLDIEIIRLTDGQKTLIDVIQELSQKYGIDQPFDEDTFIPEFVSLVHSDLQIFFDKYIEGNEALPYRDVLETVGVEYLREIKEERPRDPVKDNKVKRSKMIFGGKVSIKKVGKKDWVGFEKGDLIDRNVYHDVFKDEYGEYVKDGDVVEIPVVRNEEEIFLPVKVEYIEAKTEYRLRIKQEMTTTQERYFNIWLGIKND